MLASQAMTKFAGWTTAVVTMCAAAVVVASPAQQAPAAIERLNPRIGPANPKLYESIVVAEDWKNPYLVVRRGSIDVIASGIPSGRRAVAPTELRRTLIDLPVTAWPYGRVVAVQPIGIRAGDGRDDKPIADNLYATLSMLKTLQVTIETWPGA
jgi:hypothetical protein